MKQGQNPNLCLHSAEPREDTAYTETRTKIDILLMAITRGASATRNGHQEDIDFSPRSVYVGFRPSFMDLRPI